MDPLWTLLAAVVALTAWLVVRGMLRRREEARRWHVVTRTRDDGTHVVVIQGPGGGEHLVRELEPGLSGATLTAELRDARAQAFVEADRLNRPPEPAAGRVPVARTRS